MPLTTVQKRFGMHNYGIHKAYLAVLVVVSSVGLLNRCPFFQLHTFSLSKQKAGQN